MQNGTFYKKVGFDGAKVWKTDRFNPGGAYKRQDGLAVPVRLRAGEGGPDQPSAGRPYDQLRLRER